MLTRQSEKDVLLSLVRAKACLLTPNASFEVKDIESLIRLAHDRKWEEMVYYIEVHLDHDFKGYVLDTIHSTSPLFFKQFFPLEHVRLKRERKRITSLLRVRYERKKRLWMQ